MTSTTTTTDRAATWRDRLSFAYLTTLCGKRPPAATVAAQPRMAAPARTPAAAPLRMTTTAPSKRPEAARAAAHAAARTAGRAEGYREGVQAEREHWRQVFTLPGAAQFPALAAGLAAEQAPLTTARSVLARAVATAPDLTRADRAARNPRLGDGGTLSALPGPPAGAGWDRHMRGAAGR